MRDAEGYRAVRAMLNRLWRIIMTGVCFALFGLGGLALSVVWFNLLLLVQRDPLRRRRLARRSISFSFRFFMRTMTFLGVLDYRIDGAELLRRDRRCLIVANHPSLIDYVMLASVMPDVDCLVKAGLQRNPFISGVIRAAEYLVNSQSETLLPDCQQRLDNGEAIMIFPEGTRTRYGEPLKLQRGAANIAVRCGCDLRIVHIRCSQRMLDKQSRWYQVPPEKPRFTVTVGERIESQQFMAGNEDAQPLAARHLTQFLQQALTPEHE
ncbi:lysophospholipid acyltransferase family protein [Erwinia sp. E_sp_B04_7]|uniref:lysophospholipid acyltransferase family protein n=1 Tax=unclassified Erwinia TaxID=2622719 RepID=UPI0030CDC6BF